GEHLRGDLDAIVMKALRAAPGERHATADELAQDIEDYLHHRPVRARTGTFGYRAGKFARRHVAGISAGILIMAALAAAVAATTVQARRAAVETRRASAGFEDVRRLSNLLLLDLNEQVKQLPGSTEVQQQM